MAGNDAFTVLLLHCDGADGSTTFTDSSASAHVFTANANAQIDTAAFKFGTSAALFDGSADSITTPDSDDWNFGSGDWTVDLWFNRNGGSGRRTMIGITNGSGSAASTVFGIELNASNVVNAFVSNGGLKSVTGTTIFTTTGFHHVALVRTGNVVRLFVDGIQEGGDLAVSGALPNSGSSLAIGRFGDFNGLYWNGWIDEVRISKGIARWTSNFTPPTQAYSSTTVFNQSVSISATGTVSATKSISKALNLSGSGSVTLQRAISLILPTISATGTVAVTSGRAFVKVISIAASGSVSLLKQVGKIVSTSATGTLSFPARQISKIISETVTGSPAIQKSIATVKTFAATGTARVSKSASKALSFTASGAVTIAKGIGRVVIVSITAVGSLTIGKSVARTISITAFATVSLLKSVGKTIALTATAVLEFLSKFIKFSPRHLSAGGGATTRAGLSGQSRAQADTSGAPETASRTGGSTRIRIH